MWGVTGGLALTSELQLWDFIEVESQVTQGPLSGKKELESVGKISV